MNKSRLTHIVESCRTHHVDASCHVYEYALSHGNGRGGATEANSLGYFEF